jgi:RHS repeat-associated protein
VTVAYEYDSGGRLVTMAAYNAKGSGNGVQSQATKYLYTSAVNASWQTAAVYPDTTDWLSQDSGTKVWTFTTDYGDHVSTAYDRLGRTTGTTDQRGVVHEYTFDSAGRLSADTASDLGSSGDVDGGVRRIGTAYDDLGRVETVTSYSDTSGTTVVNQVKYVYTGWGQVAREYQEHDGAVDANTLLVQYDYEDGAASGVAKYVRLEQVTYPNGREVQYGYGTTGAVDDIMSRLATIGDGTTTQAAYTYLGAGKIVVEDYVESQTRLTYLNSSDAVTGLDRFGRVADQIWERYGDDPAVLDEYTYTYDRAGNRTSRDNELHAAFDEDYTYNGLDELVSSSRADDFDQSWTLDGLGNFSAFDDDGASQTRTANGANEITAITGGWASPVYDLAGNMTTIPSPQTGDPDHALAAKYDAWNRLVEVSDGGVLVAKFSYDASGRRIEKLTDFVDGVPQDATHYFLSGQQVIETRAGSPASSPESLNPEYQNVWSLRYVDSLVLRDTYSGGVIQPASRLYYLADANYNVTALVGKVSDQWQVVERYVYTPYGKATILDPDFSADADNTSDFSNTTLYTGRELDPETSLYYYRARYYSAELGTFVGRDPIEFLAGDANLYRYVFNNPLVYTDPFGEQSAGAHHPYPLYLGGCMGQDLIMLTAQQHKEVHKYLRSIGWGYNDISRARWAKMCLAEQAATIAESLRAAKIPNRVIEEVMAKAMACAKAGVRTPRVGRRGKVIKCFGIVVFAVAIACSDDVEGAVVETFHPVNILCGGCTTMGDAEWHHPPPPVYGPEPPAYPYRPILPSRPRPPHYEVLPPTWPCRPPMYRPVRPPIWRFAAPYSPRF